MDNIRIALYSIRTASSTGNKIAAIHSEIPLPGFYLGIIDCRRISQDMEIPGYYLRIITDISELRAQKMVQFIHGELSYRIIGLLYKIYNAMGPGFQEKYYQNAIRKVFEKEKIPFLEQVRMDINIVGANIGRYYVDFIVNHKIALEIKSKTFFSQKDIRQILGYLKKSGLEVGLLAAFSSEGLKIKRLLRGFPEKSNNIQ